MAVVQEVLVVRSTLFLVGKPQYRKSSKNLWTFWLCNYHFSKFRRKYALSHLCLVEIRPFLPNWRHSPLPFSGKLHTENGHWWLFLHYCIERYSRVSCQGGVEPQCSRVFCKLDSWLLVSSGYSQRQTTSPNMTLLRYLLGAITHCRCQVLFC